LRVTVPISVACETLLFVDRMTCKTLPLSFSQSEIAQFETEIFFQITHIFQKYLDCRQDGDIGGEKVPCEMCEKKYRQLYILTKHREIDFSV
jgi:hypothetical protein